MAAWKKILVDNISTSGSTHTNNHQFTGDNIALKTDNALPSTDGTGRLVLHSSAGTSNLVWKEVATTLNLITDNNSSEAANNAVDLIDENLSVLGGTGIATSVTTDNTIQISGEDATTAHKGIAKFDPSDFQVNAGNVMVKPQGISNNQLAGGITNDNLANSFVSYGGVQVSLGDTNPKPAFDLEDAHSYPGDSDLTIVGTVTSGQFGTSGTNLPVYASGGTINNTPIGATTPSSATFTGSLKTAAGTNIHLNHGSTTNLGGGEVVIGASTTGSPATNVKLAHGNLEIQKGSLSVQGDVNLADGAMQIHNASADQAGGGNVITLSATNWNGSGTTVSLQLAAIGTSLTLSAGDYYFPVSETSTGSAVSNEFVKLSLASTSASITGSGANITFTIEEWPQFDNNADGTLDSYYYIQGGAYFYTQNPAGDIHVSFGDNVIFYGGGVLTSTSNFASTDNVIHLNTVDSNSDGSQDSYASTTDSAIVFGSTAASGANNFIKGGKIICTETDFILSGLKEETTVTTANQDNIQFTGLKTLQTKGIIFKSGTSMGFTGPNDVPAGADAAIGLVDGVLMAYV